MGISVRVCGACLRGLLLVLSGLLLVLSGLLGVRENLANKAIRLFAWLYQFGW
jgi:hypothetical protein